jgi:hypothetical protein
MDLRCSMLELKIGRLSYRSCMSDVRFGTIGDTSGCMPSYAYWVFASSSRPRQSSVVL